MTAQLINYIDMIGMIAGINRNFSMDEIGRAARCLQKGMSANDAATEMFC